MQEKPTLSFSLKGKSTTKKPSSVLESGLFSLSKTDIQLSDRTAPLSEADTQIRTDSSDTNSEPWLVKGLVVKVIHKQLGEGKYFGRLAIVQGIVEKYGATLQVIDNSDLIQLDQEDLEPALPLIDNLGLLVLGEERGRRARVVYRHPASKEVEVELEEGPRRGHRKLIPIKYISRHTAFEHDRIV